MSAENDARNKLNREVCVKLINHLQAAGWEFITADDENARELPVEEAAELVHQLDGASMYFKKGDDMQYVLFTPYNTGLECIVDWNYKRADVNGFNALMETFLEKERQYK